MREVVTVTFHEGVVTVEVQAPGVRSPYRLGFRAYQALGDTFQFLDKDGAVSKDSISWRAPSGEGEPVEDSRDG